METILHEAGSLALHCGFNAVAGHSLFSIPRRRGAEAALYSEVIGYGFDYLLGHCLDQENSTFNYLTATVVSVAGSLYFANKVLEYRYPEMKERTPDWEEYTATRLFTMGMLKCIQLGLQNRDVKMS